MQFDFSESRVWLWKKQRSAFTGDRILYRCTRSVCPPSAETRHFTEKANFFTPAGRDRWSYDGSDLLDVTFAQGGSLYAYQALPATPVKAGMRVDVPPAIVTAMAIGDQFGLMLDDEKGQTQTRHMLDSRESVFPPVLIVEGTPSQRSAAGPVRLINSENGRKSLRPGMIFLRIRRAAAGYDAAVCNPADRRAQLRVCQTRAPMVDRSLSHRSRIRWPHRTRSATMRPRWSKNSSPAPRTISQLVRSMRAAMRARSRLLDDIARMLATIRHCPRCLRQRVASEPKQTTADGGQDLGRPRAAQDQSTYRSVARTGFPEPSRSEQRMGRRDRHHLAHWRAERISGISACHRKYTSGFGHRGEDDQAPLRRRQTADDSAGHRSGAVLSRVVCTGRQRYEPEPAVVSRSACAFDRSVRSAGSRQCRAGSNCAADIRRRLHPA